MLALLLPLIWTQKSNSELARKIEEETHMDGGRRGFYIISSLSPVFTRDIYMLFSFPFCFEQLIEWLLSDVQMLMIFLQCDLHC